MFIKVLLRIQSPDIIHERSLGSYSPWKSVPWNMNVGDWHLFLLLALQGGYHTLSRPSKLSRLY